MNKLQSIRKDFKKHQEVLERLLDKAEAFALKSGDRKLALFLERERGRINNSLRTLATSSSDLYPAFQRELQKRTRRLELKVEKLSKAKDVLVSDNYLLEYKKKDLLILANKLEEANEEISKKNSELILQQERIREQTEQLNAVNQELERQKEGLLDQSDYLHEANETITRMHQEVEKQKDEILKKNQELLSLNNEKNNLIGIVAHDLKSPLNQIRGLLTLMKVSFHELPDDALAYIDMIEKSSERLSEMIGKILDVEAIEHKNLNVALEEVNIASILSSLVDRYQHTAGEKSITLCMALSPANALVDRGFAEQVFENILSNAIKFSPRDRSVYINLSKHDGKAVCEIRDEGPGLTDNDKKKLFGKYQKLSARPTGNETSTGLGLSIVKRFVESMDGRIWCESQAGKGASFFVAFKSTI